MLKRQAHINHRAFHLGSERKSLLSIPRNSIHQTHKAHGSLIDGGSNTGGRYFISLKTGKRLHADKQTKVTVSKEVIDRAHTLADGGKQPWLEDISSLTESSNDSSTYGSDSTYFSEEDEQPLDVSEVNMNDFEFNMANVQEIDRTKVSRLVQFRHIHYRIRTN